MQKTFGFYEQMQEDTGFLNDLDSIQIAEQLDLLAHDFFKEQVNAIDKKIHYRVSFNESTIHKWGNTFRLFELFVTTYLEIAKSYTENILNKPDSRDLRFVALTQLHARSVLTLREIQALMESGFPDGALARWRTIHELSVISCIVSISETYAKKYLLSEHIKNYKGAKCLNQYANRLKHRPYSPDQLAIIESFKDYALEELGEHNEHNDYYWAKSFLIDKGCSPKIAKSPNLFELEKKTGLEHFRPYFLLACEKIHAPAKTNYANLAPSQSSQPVLVVGPTDSGFVTPLDLAMLSSSETIRQFMGLFPSVDTVVLINSLEIMRTKVIEAALEIEPLQLADNN